ncbi:MAG: hypothetical protein U0736_13745 [Gemmataceae bacterium]
MIQSLALLRPGAAGIGMKELFVRRRRGLEPEQTVDPAVRTVLGDTHGLMLYEDDALRLIQGLTGLPAADADRLRKPHQQAYDGRRRPQRCGMSSSAWASGTAWHGQRWRGCGRSWRSSTVIRSARATRSATG